jgi:hypothetical protein
MMVFTFESLEDLHRVLDYSPWNIKGSPLFLKKWSAEEAIKDLDFTKAAYWVQVHNLPLELIIVANAKNIGASVGVLLEVDNANCSKPVRKGFFRFRVLLNLLNPLIPGFTHHRPPMDPLWVRYKYERLSDYCYTCGRIGNLSFACPVDPRPPDHGRYGDMLKASSPKTSRVVQIIQLKSRFSEAFSMVSVSNRLGTESTLNSRPSQPHQFTLLQPSTSWHISKYHSTSPILLSPTSSVSELMVKALFVNLQPQHTTPPLLLTSIEKFNSLNLHFPQPTWPALVSTTTLELGSNSSYLVSSKTKLVAEETSSSFPSSVVTSAAQVTCGTSPTCVATSTYPPPQNPNISFSTQSISSCLSPQNLVNTNSPHDLLLSSLSTSAAPVTYAATSSCIIPISPSVSEALPSSKPQTLPISKPPRHPNKKRFHPYSISPSSKKSKLGCLLPNKFLATNDPQLEDG